MLAARYQSAVGRLPDYSVKKHTTDSMCKTTLTVEVNVQIVFYLYHNRN